MNFLLRIHGARQLLLVCTKGERVLCGQSQKTVATLESSNGLSVLVDERGCIHDFGEDSEISERYQNSTFETELDATGMCVLPGNA